MAYEALHQAKRLPKQPIGPKCLPGQHESRNSHPHEWHSRYDRARARDRSLLSEQQEYLTIVQNLGRLAAEHSQRYFRFLQDRSRQTSARPGALCSARAPRHDDENTGPARPSKGSRTGVRRASRRAGYACMGTPDACGRFSSTWSATPSSSPSRGGRRRHPASGRATHRRPARTRRP